MPRAPYPHRFHVPFLAATILFSVAGCDATPRPPTPGLQTGHMEISPEARTLLPKGAVLYYSKSNTLGLNNRWAIEELDVDTGHTRELISTDTSGLINLQPYSVSPDHRFVLFSALETTSTATETFLAKLDIQSGTWRKIMENGIRGFYSPDGSMIALYTSRGTSQDTVVHRVYITDRAGNVLHAVPCESRSCRHPYWNPDGSSVIYVDGDSTIYSYVIKKKTRHKIIEERKPANTKVAYPIFCKSRIVYFMYEKNERYSAVLGRTASHRKLRSYQPEFLRQEDLGDFTDISGLRCPFPLSTMALAVQSKKGQGLYLTILELRTKHATRLVPLRPSKLMHINPVLVVHQ